MISGTLAKRYARALIDLAGDATTRDRYVQQLEALGAATQVDTSDGKLGVLLDAGHLGGATRLAIGRALAKRVGADAKLTRLLELLIERGRVGGLPLIARSFRDLADEAAGRVRASVSSAQPLDPSAKSKIERALASATGKKVVLETKVDPALVGGLVTTVGSYTLDRSVRASFARLRQTLHASPE